jgi:hypothetical protein
MPVAMAFFFVIINAAAPMPGFWIGFWRRQVMAFMLLALAVNNSVVPGEVPRLDPAMAVRGQLE